MRACILYGERSSCVKLVYGDQPHKPEILSSWRATNTCLMNKIPCQVIGVFMKSTEQGAMPLVVLKTEDQKCIPIYVGLWEALSISNAIRGELLPRPITHDLFIDFLERFFISISALQVDSLEDGVFYSKLFLLTDTKEEIIDCRPSDGIAIALRANAPIYVDESVRAAAGVDMPVLANFQEITTFL